MPENADLLIGLYLPGDHALAAMDQTLQSLETGHHLLVLIDPNTSKSASAFVKKNTSLKCVASTQAGRPAAINYLTSHPASYYCFIDAGVLVTGKVIDELVALMNQHPGYGMVSASTNNHWGKQSLFEDQYPELVDVPTRRKEIMQLYHGERESLAPLYDLTERFFIVKAEAVTKIGMADPHYGVGYNWEMDYCLRIAKSGYECIWSKAHYVHALTVTEEDRHQSQEYNKQYFQDKFCRNQLLQKTGTYCNHCLGEQCADFAPADLITTFIDSSSAQTPLVSCIMPTSGRPQYVALAIQYFHEQDYPSKELIIIYHEAADLPAIVKAHPAIKFHQISRDSTIGEKRNMGCEHATGSIMIQWDDDDIYATDRISQQVAPIIDQSCDLTALHSTLFMDSQNGDFWQCSAALYDQMFVHGVLGGSLAYRKSLWSALSGYPDTSLREDADFLVSLLDRGARFQKIDGRNLYVYLRHDQNTWKFHTGRFISPHDWWQTDAPETLVKYLSAYATNEQKRLDTDHISPMVSCIMPTRNRRAFIPNAITCFLNQQYEQKELIIVDDGEDAIADLLPDDERIRYIRLTGRQTIGAKRNLAIENATGSVIMHLDDDDWISPQWIQLQTGHLLATRADVTGLDLPCFYQLDKRRTLQYLYPFKNKPWVHGGTLCYTRKTWESNHFEDRNVGEDVYFLWHGIAKKIIPHFHIGHYIGCIHEHNISPKNVEESCWRIIESEQLEATFQEVKSDLNETFRKEVSC